MFCNFGEFCYHIAPEFIGSLLSLIGGAFLIQRYFGRRANEAAFVDVLIKKLEEISEDALEYWTEGFEKDAGKKRRLEQRLKAGLEGLYADLRDYRQRYREKDRDQYEYLVTQLTKEVTGGKFEGRIVKADLDRHLRVVKISSCLRSQLMRNKL